MILGIDASRFGQEHSTGVEMYSFHIIRELLKLIDAGNSPVSEVVLYTPREISKELLGGDYDFCRQQVIRARRLWTQIGLSREMKRHPPDVLFVPSHTLPIVCPRKSIVMIHDVAFMRFARAYSFFQYFYLRYSTSFAVRNAAKILVPSRATKNDLIHFFGCRPEKIEAIPHGFTSAQLVPEKLPISGSYFLYVGRLEEKKNLVRLVRAFKKFHEKNPDWKLVLAGKRGFGFKKLYDEIQKLNLWHCVLMPGYVTEGEKAALFRGSRGFVFPSLYEGFGLPILEAFYFEKPVLTSTAGALREVCGDAAVMVDPIDEIAIFDGLEQLKNSENLIAKGKERVRLFDWEKSAMKTLEILTR